MFVHIIYDHTLLRIYHVVSEEILVCIRKLMFISITDLKHKAKQRELMTIEADIKNIQQKWKVTDVEHNTIKLQKIIRNIAITQKHDNDLFAVAMNF